MPAAPRKKKFLVAAVFVVLAGGIACFAFMRDGGTPKVKPDKKTTSENATSQTEIDREALLAELVKKRGGLPVDLALKEATTPEAKAFLERDLAYQRQTREQAADEARERLDAVKAQLGKETDEKKKDVLERQVEMLEAAISKLKK